MLYVVPRLNLTVVMTSDNGASAARSGHRGDLHQLMARIIIVIHTAAAASGNAPLP